MWMPDAICAGPLCAAEVTDSLFHHFPEHHRKFCSTFPSAGRTSPNQTCKAALYMPPTEGWVSREESSPSCIFFNYQTCQWWQRSSRGAHPSHPGLLLYSAGITRASLSKHPALTYYWSLHCWDRKLHWAVCPRSPMSHSNGPPAPYLSLSLLCVCVSVWNTVHKYPAMNQNTVPAWEFITVALHSKTILYVRNKTTALLTSF